MHELSLSSHILNSSPRGNTDLSTGVYGNIDIFFGIANCLGLARGDSKPGKQHNVNDD